MVKVAVVVVVVMMELGLALMGLERGNIEGEREGDGTNATAGWQDGWLKRTAPQRCHAHQVYGN